MNEIKKKCFFALFFVLVSEEHFVEKNKANVYIILKWVHQ